MKLVPLTEQEGIEIYNMLQEIGRDENGFHNAAFGLSREECKEVLKKEYGYSHGVLEDWMVPQTSYWMYDGETPVGYARIRHFLNEGLRESGGHISYAVPRSQRGKGYGNEILRLVLIECRNLGIEEVQIGANADNMPSNRIIVRHGGVLQRSVGGKNIYLIANG